MKSTFISRENNDVKLRLEFSAEEFDAAIIKAYQEKKGRYTVDGFRKGKAPRKRIEAFYGKDVFYDDAVNDLLNDAYPKAVEELSLEPVDRPTADLGDQVLEEGKGFTVDMNVTVMPEISLQGYKGVEIEKVEEKVADDAVDAELEKVRERNSRMVLVEDRPAQKGDTVLLDYAGFVGEEQFAGGTAERQPLTLGSQTFIPGFEEQLEGVSAGEEREVKVTFPEDYHAENLKGKEAVFKCKIHEIKEKVKDELNDDFAKEVSEFDTLDEFKADIRAKLEKGAADRSRRAMRDAALEKVCEANEFEIPKAMIDSEAYEMLREMEQQLQYQGLTLEQYMKYLNKSADDIMADMAPDAEFRVKNRLIMKAIAKAEDLKVEDADMDEALAKLAESYQMEPDKMKEMIGADGLDYLKADVLNTKAVDFIMDNAVIKEAAKEA